MDCCQLLSRQGCAHAVCAVQLSIVHAAVRQRQIAFALFKKKNRARVRYILSYVHTARPGCRCALCTTCLHTLRVHSRRRYARCTHAALQKQPRYAAIFLKKTAKKRVHLDHLRANFAKSNKNNRLAMGDCSPAVSSRVLTV